MTDASGNVVGEQRYYPYGETRLTTGTIYTDQLFTGQREMAGLGIYHYGARFYSPKVGRFLSPDTIVPNAFNPQDLNRFSYVRNNPLRYTDPTGHQLSVGEGGGGGCYPFCTPPPPPTCSSSICNPNVPPGEGGGDPFEPACDNIFCDQGSPDECPLGKAFCYSGDTPEWLIPAEPQNIAPPNIALPSWVDIINFLFEPSPDPGVGDLFQVAADSSPVFPTPFGPITNPLFGSGQAIGDAVDAIGVTLYMVVNYVEFPSPAGGTPSPIISTDTCLLGEAYCYSSGASEWMIPVAPFPP